VPALEEESGSEAVALGDSDTDLETSDFDLALGEEDVAAEEESGSQVVALEDEGEVDESAETQQARRKAKRGGAVIAEDDSSEEVEELFDVSTEGAAAPRGGAVGAPAAPANWGPLPAIVMLLCVVIMFLSTLMGLELIRTMTGYRQPSTLTRAIVQQFAGDELPKGD
jgi:hypothetical protein